MFHPTEVQRSPGFVKAGDRRRLHGGTLGDAVVPGAAPDGTRHPGPRVQGSTRRGHGIRTLLGLPLIAALVACEGTTTVLPTPRFGQQGEIQVEVRSPLPGGQGFLSETVVWRSDGRWTLSEQVFYRGIQGSVTVRASRMNPGELTLEYASLIRQLNETPGLRLFGGAVSQALEPACDPSLEPGSLPTRVAVTIRDNFRGETARWVRCARGTLFTITPGESGPDLEASRVITAGQLARSFTLGESSSPTYPGTEPYGTLAQGGHSPALPAGSRVFASEGAFPPADFVEFWEAHAGPGVPIPFVSWGSDMVLLAAVGEKPEAGTVLQVKRVAPIGEGTRVELVERVPGDFCSPAAKRVHPYHLVVAPAMPAPIEFTAPEVERIPCGL